MGFLPEGTLTIIVGALLSAYIAWLEHRRKLRDDDHRRELERTANVVARKTEEVKAVVKDRLCDQLRLTWLALKGKADASQNDDDIQAAALARTLYDHHKRAHPGADCGGGVELDADR